MPEEIVDQGLGAEADRLQQVEKMLTGDKIPPEQVNYDAAPEGSLERCGVCANFEMPERSRSTCRIVAGEVQATGLCDMFEPSMDGQDPLGTAAEGITDGNVENPLAGL